MTFFDYEISIRINKDIEDRIGILLKNNPEIDDVSHLVRCAINFLYNQQ